MSPTIPLNDLTDLEIAKHAEDLAYYLTIKPVGEIIGTGSLINLLNALAGRLIEKDGKVDELEEEMEHKEDEMMDLHNRIDELESELEEYTND